MSAEFKDYYATLGVPREASQDDIKKAFRKLARKHHPDVAKDRPGSEAKFKEINEANEVLSDPEKRKKYDRLGADWQNEGFTPPPGHGGAGLAGIFGKMDVGGDCAGGVGRCHHHFRVQPPGQSTLPCDGGR